jgi:hypothetical protein
MDFTAPLLLRHARASESPRREYPAGWHARQSARGSKVEIRAAICSVEAAAEKFCRRVLTSVKYHIILAAGQEIFVRISSIAGAGIDLPSPHRDAMWRSAISRGIGNPVRRNL